jgi:preprotein translocase subunit SecF
LLVVIIFLAMTFEPKMALAAIIAVIHDVFITVGIYALVGFDVTPATIIGFLTIMGYSLYDTVVVFDKVRENTKSIAATGKSTYSDAANLAVNQTIVRSINTSIIALLPVGSILFVGAGLLGAGTLKDLSLSLFIGLAVGTYSSIFIAPPFLASLREKEPAMIALRKRVESRGTSPVAVAAVASARPTETRGPRNQPKRKGRK